MASQTLGRAIPGTISIDPWRTEDAVLKLLAYAMMFWLTLSMSARARDAERLLGAVIASSAGYGLYGFVLTAIGTTQAAILYTVSVPASYVSGPFMLHNSFATFEGIGFLACVVKGLDLARESVVISRGPTRFLETALQFVIGRGAFVLIAGLLTFSAVVASASRAGSVATGVAFLAILLMSYRLAARGQRSSWLPVLSLVGLFTVLIAILLSGQTLGDRLAELAGGGETDSIRLALWDASVRMISDFPWVGLGLGSFPDAYPLYARSVIPYVTDKAHSDYLELAAGLGLPAAIAFWLSVAWMCVLCIRGFLRRRRDHHFALLGFGATVLVAVHATVDFSLQLPAVGLTYALVLGLGVGQSARSAENGSDGRRS
jgi:O-antigen ligase